MSKKFSFVDACQSGRKIKSEFDTDYGFKSVKDVLRELSRMMETTATAYIRNDWYIEEGE